jgi:hypothetical protein
MGYIKHNAIVCTTWKQEDAVEAQRMAKKLFAEYEEGSEKLVSELVEYIVNDGYSFFIAPDGSKEGWETSNNCDKAREKFLDWLHKADNYCDYIEVRFGGDDDHNTIERTNATDY